VLIWKHSEMQQLVHPMSPGHRLLADFSPV